jgi:hypothetical protein
LFVVLYGHETVSLNLRDEYLVRIFENRVLRKILGREREEVTRYWRKYHNEELHDLYSTSNIIRVVKLKRMRWAGRVARMREKYIKKLEMGKLVGQRQL